MENTPSEKGKPFKEKTQHKDLRALWQTPQTEMFVIRKEMQNLQWLHHFAALTEVASRSRAYMDNQPQTKLDVCLFKIGYRCPNWCGSINSLINTGSNTIDKTRHAVNPRDYTNWSLKGRVWNASSDKYQREYKFVTFRNVYVQETVSLLFGKSYMMNFNRRDENQRKRRLKEGRDQKPLMERF